MAQLSKCFLSGDFRDWPLDQATVCELVRVRMVRAQKDSKTQYRELQVRSRVVKEMAKLYMDRHVQDLGRRFKVLKLLRVSEAQPMAHQIKDHIDERVKREYPDEIFGGEDGAIPEQIKQMLRHTSIIQSAYHFMDLRISQFASQKHGA